MSSGIKIPKTDEETVKEKYGWENKKNGEWHVLQLDYVNNFLTSHQHVSSWIQFIGRADVEAETLILWPPDVKSWLIWKDPNAGKDWGQEEKGTTEDKIAGWHHQLDWHETPGVGDGQGGLVCCGSSGHKELGTTERLNWYWYQIIKFIFIK